MSSPFRYFRKHTKTFMAVAAVLCMFIFVIGGSLGGGGRSSDENRAAQAPVAEWDGGAINQGELASLVQRRLLTDQFLQRLFIEGGGRSQYDATVPLFFTQTQNRTRTQVEQEVIFTEVFASLAQQAGMSVSDNLINHYLEELGSKNVDGAGVVAILKNMGQGNSRTNEAVVFDTLRKILLGYFYRSAYADASQTVLPYERWEDWLKVNERIALQAAVLPVASFVAQVPPPTDAQLKSLYEEFKNEVPGLTFTVGTRQLDSPNPGFAEPRRVRLQYVLGSLQARTDFWLPKVSEAEIEEYYERNKRIEFIKMSLPGEEKQEPETPATESTPEAPATDSEEPNPATESTDEPAAPAMNASESEPTTTDSAETPEATPPAEPAPAESAPAEPTTEKPAAENEAPPAADAEAAEAEEEGGDTSSLPRKSPFQLAAFQAPAAAGDAAAQESAETPAEEATSEPSATTEQSAAPAAEDAATDEAAPASDEKVQYEPLENVRDEIRRTIAAEKAADELDGIMARATAQLQTEFNRFTVTKAGAASRKEAPPKPPEKLTDLKWLADEHGLTAERMALLSDRELFDTAVGKAVDEATGSRVVTQAAFTTLKLYEPLLAKTRDGDWYLVNKIEDVPQRVPPFDEVQEKVLAAWKHREAAKLAEKTAQELAAEVEKSSTDFNQFFAGKGYEVINETSLFSWLEYPAGAMGSGSPPGLGDIPELSSIGPDFLRTIFTLGENKVVGLLNFDKSTAYVVRVARRQYTEDELRELFLEEANTWPGRRDMLMSHISTFNSAMFKELRERAGLKFDETWEKEQAEREHEVN